VSFDSKTYKLLHGIRASFLDDDGRFPPDVEHVFVKKLSHVRGRVKVSYIAKKYMTWGSDFISHGDPSSPLEASFESK
jgi:hypothetical protein